MKTFTEESKDKIIEISSQLESGKIDFPEARKQLTLLLGFEYKVKYKGKAIVRTKGNRRLIYEGHTLQIIGLYMTHREHDGDILSGTREFRLSLIGTPFEESLGYKDTVINERDLEILELETY